MLLLAAPAPACLWDNDTLVDERRGLPGIAELLAGKWERHSRFFYEHRAEVMRSRIARDANDLASYDNLAVALEKLGDPNSGIEVMLRKDAVKPGEYTTYANLGTLYLHTGDFEKGIATIGRALAINPSAHFGREEYQLRLAEFLRGAKADPALLRSGSFLFRNWASEASDGGRPILIHFSGSPERLKDFLKPNAIDALVGIIRFGTGRNADLYYALGDALAVRGDHHLAYRAYQRAADLDAARSDMFITLRDEAAQGVEEKKDLRPEVLAAERASADEWVNAYQAFEDGLIRAGKDPEDQTLLAPFYRLHGPATVAPTLLAAAAARAGWISRNLPWVLPVAGGLTCLSAYIGVRDFRRRSSRPRR